MGESRSDLLAWINELLQLNVAKIESLGSGAVYCQILDSIYGDVPLQKVQFQAKQEYQYLSNFKVLQDQFKRHKIDKPIPVEGLIRCKMQDNLEFTQWIKKFWDAEWPGEEYDAVGRRGGAGGGRGATPSSMSSSSARPSATTRAAPSSASTARRAPAASTSTAGARRPVGSAGSTGVRTGPSSKAAPAAAASNAAIQELTREMSEMRVSVEALEKERDFYFGKLREIEIIVAARLEEPEEGVEEGDILKSIQEILYQTEEGFEIPDEEGPLADEEETF